MPTFTLTALTQGQSGIEASYRSAIEIWKEIIESDDFIEFDLLAIRIGVEQPRFMQGCTDKYLAKEIMAITGIMQFYNEYIGFDGTYLDAIKVKEAVLESKVSIEVKWFIEKIAAFYKLDENYKPDWAED
jgi:hypothetical protein